MAVPSSTILRPHHTEEPPPDQLCRLQQPLQQQNNSHAAYGHAIPTPTPTPDPTVSRLHLPLYPSAPTPLPLQQSKQSCLPPPLCTSLTRLPQTKSGHQVKRSKPTLTEHKCQGWRLHGSSYQPAGIGSFRPFADNTPIGRQGQHIT